MSLIENERTKLAATALNNVAVATVATALIAPSAAFLYGSAAAGPRNWWGLIALAWFIAGVVLHVLAHIVLGRLKP